MAACAGIIPALIQTTPGATSNEVVQLPAGLRQWNLAETGSGIKALEEQGQIFPHDGPE
jgi:hypothetical protein